MLNSSIAYHKQTALVALSLTEEDRARVTLSGATPADIERIQSGDEDEDDEPHEGDHPEEEGEQGDEEIEADREESM